MSYHVAVDIGASGGKILLSEIDKENNLQVDEIHHFKNGFRHFEGHYRWDVDRLFNEIIIGLKKVKMRGVQYCTLGIDTWAVDYCLVDENGGLISQPISYRDNRTNGVLNQVCNKISIHEIYHKTGIQFQNFNTLFQLYVEENHLLEQTDQILMIPDYLTYRLTGVKIGEETNFSTTQLLDISTKNFDEDLLKILNIPRGKFPKLVPAGTVVGELKDDIRKKENLPLCKVIAVATHDTASAIAGVPATTEDWAYLSSGTWSLIGIENKEPIISEETLNTNYTNEWGAFNTYRFLKNISGMWFIQEIARVLDYKYSYTEMAEAAKKVEPFLQYIDLSDSRFRNPENMITEIRAYCTERNLIIPKTIGELTMAVYSNLALAYSKEWERLTKISGKPLNRLHIVGGGGNVDILNQLTTNLINKKVIVGPTEASAIGNIVIQLISEGKFKTLKESRKWLATQISLKEYTPNQKSDKLYLENKNIIY